MDKKVFVLWKWDNEVYEVLNETSVFYFIKNIKFNHVARVDKKDVIVINNM